MAEPYQPINVNTGSSQQAIQATQNVTPALDGLMTHIKEGFISADDIRKRVASGPLEAATRAQDTADMQQVRPIKREEEMVRLQNLQAKEQFEANSLPILNDIKRVTLEKAHNNALQFGVPEEILKVFYASVPNFIPFDPEKLHDKKTGQVNIPYANEMIMKARQAAAKMAASKPVTVDTKIVTATGETRTSKDTYDPETGARIGASIPTGGEEPSAAKEAEDTAKLDAHVNSVREASDTVKAYIPQARAFSAVEKLKNNPRPKTNADHLAMMYEFIKILDPTSVVREGELKFTASVAPGVERLWDSGKGFFSGTRMSEDTINKFYDTIDDLKISSEEIVIPELKRLKNVAEARGTPLTLALTEPEINLLINGPSGFKKLGVVSAPTASGGTPASDAPTIDTSDRVAAAAALRALPPNVRYARFSDEPGVLIENPNYKP